MIYRLAHAVNASYGLAVAWAYIGAFLLALGLLFIFPQVTLLLFFLALGSLGLTIGLGAAIDWLTRILARRGLARGRCPRCGDVIAGGPVAAEWRCPLCSSHFAIDGAEIDLKEQQHFVEQPGDDPQAAAVAWRDS